MTGETHIRRPTIVISRSDYARLSGLADATASRNPETSDVLAGELDRALIVADDELDPRVVKMGSTVEYRTDTGESRKVSLVFPGEADITLDRISILTPIGVALLGLSAGQSIDWTARDGRRHCLTVVSVAADNASEAI